MSKLEEAKVVIKKYFDEASCGIYNCRNIVGDYMCTVYSKDKVTIEVCFEYGYFEVFGLSADEFKALYDYYNTLHKNNKK